jgi:hypothetical protein
MASGEAGYTADPVTRTKTYLLLRLRFQPLLRLGNESFRESEQGFNKRAGGWTHYRGFHHTT